MPIIGDMDLKHLIGIDNTGLSEFEIIKIINDAINNNKPFVEIIDKEGKKITIKIPVMDYSKYVEPWPVSSS